MDADDGDAPAAEQPTPAPAAVGDAQPEVELYLHLLLLVRLLDAKDFDTVRSMSERRRGSSSSRRCSVVKLRHV